MKRKIPVLALALILILSIFSCALAEPEAKCEGTIMKIYIDAGASTVDLCNSEVRGLTSASMFLDYTLKLDESAANKLSTVGTFYISAFSDVSIDLFIPMNDGTYLNLFYTCPGNELYSYGFVDWTPVTSEDHVYESFSADEFVTGIETINTAINS